MPILDIAFSVFSGLVVLPVFANSFAIVGCCTGFCLVASWMRGR